VIYVNGDSHTAGADIIPGISFAEDDPKYLSYGRKPHPLALIQTWGYKYALHQQQEFYCDAESASSNDRILRTTRKFLETADLNNTYVIIAWSTCEREEWQYNNDYFQVTASGTDSVPESMVDAYKKWVVEQTAQRLLERKEHWKKCIHDFSTELKTRGCKHYFFTTEQYTDILKHRGYKTYKNHFGADAHTAWAKQLRGLVGANFFPDFTLTKTYIDSILTDSKVNKLKA
jgi:hypothetical protein|tara:strand:- start:497 stop:1189 length:693 start_codon:yes stop_codon:yes gene_type:complete